jgi:hypothetical protein
VLIGFPCQAEDRLKLVFRVLLDENVIVISQNHLVLAIRGDVIVRPGQHLFFFLASVNQVPYQDEPGFRILALNPLPELCELGEAAVNVSYCVDHVFLLKVEAGCVCAIRKPLFALWQASRYAAGLRVLRLLGRIQSIKTSASLFAMGLYL